MWTVASGLPSLNHCTDAALRLYSWLLTEAATSRNGGTEKEAEAEARGSRTRFSAPPGHPLCTTRPPPWPAGGVRPRLLGCPRLLQEGALCCPADRSCSLHWRCSSCSRWRCAAASRSWRWHCSSCPCRRRAAASHFLRCAQFVQHLSSSLHCCCCCCCCKAAAAHIFIAAVASCCRACD